jgi:glutathione S-transferase
MLTLCGFPISNYYNKVKMILLEKNVPFIEEHIATGRKDEEVLSCSPLGKIPFLRTPQGPICESEAIAAYLEASYPTPALVPTDPYAAAKVRELIIFIELHVELVARELFAQAFFGGTVSESNQARVRKQLEKNIPALKRLVKFSPYIAGGSFTLADCAAFASLPLVGLTTKIMYGEDLLLAGGLDYKPYIQSLSERPSAQRVLADRKAATNAAKP